MILSLAEYLQETFDSSLPLTPPKETYDNHRTISRSFTTPKGHIITVYFDLHHENSKRHSPRWEISFAISDYSVLDKTTGKTYKQSTFFGVTGEKEAFVILSTVIKAIDEFLVSEHPQVVTFTASNPANKTSRSRLYRTMLQRMARSRGYTTAEKVLAEGSLFTLTLKDKPE